MISFLTRAPDDQPYDEKALDDESTCLALYDIVMAKTKEKADEWNGTMDVTLIFVSETLFIQIIP